MEAFLNKEILIPALIDNVKKKVPIYSIQSFKKEFENEKMIKINFFLKSKTPLLMDLNIKINVKDKDEITIYRDIKQKVFEVIGENNFMKEAFVILRMIDKKVNIKVDTLIYNNKFIYKIEINGEKKPTVYNEQMTTNDLLIEWGIYNNYKYAIEFFKVCDHKKPYTKELLKLLFDREEKIDLKLLQNVAMEYEIEKKDKVYLILSKLLKENIYFNKYYMYFLKRKDYLKIYLQQENLNKISKICTGKWLKEELKNPFIVRDPSNFDYIYKMEFKNITENQKMYINNLETALKKFWKHFEDKVNKLLTEQDFKIALDSIDFLLNKLNVMAIGTNKMKSYSLDIEDIKTDEMIKDFKGV